MPKQFAVSLQTQDPSLLLNLFGTELPTDGTEMSLAPGVNIRADRVEVQHGLVDCAHGTASATLRTPPWPAPGWECQDQRLSKG
jgi:hypothetical protein